MVVGRAAMAVRVAGRAARMVADKEATRGEGKGARRAEAAKLQREMQREAEAAARRAMPAMPPHHAPAIA